MPSHRNSVSSEAPAAPRSLPIMNWRGVTQDSITSTMRLDFSSITADINEAAFMNTISTKRKAKPDGA